MNHNPIDAALPAVKYRSPSPFLVISGHDFRSKRQANIHFISRELAHHGDVRFFSTGFSPLSVAKRDPRASLWSDANRVERKNGVDCYLWQTWWHPVNLQRLKLSIFEPLIFKAYARAAPSVLQKWIVDAGTIILESGMSIIFFELIKQLNPTATILYVCSDAIATINGASFLVEELRRTSPCYDGIRIPSHQLLSEFPQGCRVFLAPHGMDTVTVDLPPPASYGEGTNLVSVGSMLFDRKFFEIAAIEFPGVTFHVIGGGKTAEGLSAPNIRVYGEMPFKDTLAYITHAHAGIAPYDGARISAYLADTSMKLIQFGAYGLPAICPHLVAGKRRGRFGYQPGDPASISAAIQAALVSGRFQGDAPLSWAEVTNRLLCPQDYADTRIP